MYHVFSSAQYINRYYHILKMAACNLWYCMINMWPIFSASDRLFMCAVELFIASDYPCPLLLIDLTPSEKGERWTVNYDKVPNIIQLLGKCLSVCSTLCFDRRMKLRQKYSQLISSAQKKIHLILMQSRSQPFFIACRLEWHFGDFVICSL